MTVTMPDDIKPNDNPETQNNQPAKTEPEATPELGKAIAPLLAQALNFGTRKTKQEKVEEPVKEEVKTEEKVETQEKPVEEPVKEEVKTEEPAPEKKVRVSKREPLDPDKVISDAAQKLADSVLERMQQTPEKPVESTPQEPEIPDAYKAEYESLKYLAEKNPGKYKDKPSELAAFIAKENEYIDAWERDHRGQSFSPNDTEHDDFYAKNSVRYSKEDIETARIEMAADKIVKSRLAEKEQELDEIRSSQAMIEIQPKIASQRVQTVQAVVKAIQPDFADKVANEAGYKEFEESDPLTADAIGFSLQRVVPLIDELVKVYDSKGRIKSDPMNVLHMELSRISNTLEQEIQKAPAKDQMDPEGRRFCTREEYVKMTLAQRAKHWYVGKNEMISALTESAIRDAKQAIDAEKGRMKRYAKLFGYEQSGTSQDKKQPVQPKQDKVETQPVKTTPKVSSPAAGGGAKVDTASIVTPAAPSTTQQSFAQAMFGRVK